MSRQDRELKKMEDAQKAFLRANAEVLMNFARDSHRRYGRGAVGVNTWADDPNNLLRYLSDAQLTMNRTGWPDARTERYVREYDPECELVTIFLYEDRGPSVHKTRFLDLESTRT